MAEIFNNGESNASIRTKLNANADEINTIVDETIPTLVPNTRTVAGKALNANITLAKADVGLGSVDNTSDAGKPISTATQEALNGKAATGDIPTKSSLGLNNVDNTSDASKPVSTAQQVAIDARVPNTRTVNAKALSANITLDKTDIGLANVDNTSDANKPVSNAAILQFNAVNESLSAKADLVDGEIPIAQLPESNLPEQIDNETIKVNGSDKIFVNVDNVALVVVDGAITIDLTWLQAQIDSSALPIPDALIDPTVDDVTRLFTCSPNPSQPEYDNAQWETSVNNGVSYVDNENLQDPFNVGAGGKAIGQVKTRIKAVPASNRAGVPVSNLTAFTAVGDSDLITGYTYLACDLFTGTPPLINTNNNYNIGTDGYGKGQPLKNIPVGGAVAFQVQDLSKNTQCIIKDTPDTLDGGTVLEIVINNDGVVSITDTRDSISEDLATQPEFGQFINFAHVSDEPANLSTWRCSVLGEAPTFTEIWGKDFTMSYVSGSVSLLQFNTIGGTATAFKPQGLNLTNIE